jgi:hypothetical protein
MGTYCEFYVADYPVFSSKGQASPLFMTLFRERDKRVFDRRCADRNRLTWGHADWDPTEMERVVEYTSTVPEVRDRLRVMGFTLPRAMAEFESGMADHLAGLKAGDDTHGLWAETVALLERSTFADFIEAFKEIIIGDILPTYWSDTRPDASPLAVHILSDRDDFYWGFPCSDVRSFVRALLEAVPESASVTQDLTDLVCEGYYDVDDEICEMGLDDLKGDYAVNSRIILLTEGTTDSEVLRTSIDLLYPHLSGYYSFMDLAVRAPGGAGSLVHVVKSFAGAGIENRTIALLDNDAAGHSAVSVLRHIHLPPNILVMTYPDIELAANYPTCGPNGNSVQDVNGRACSIELYFGRDVLAIDGRLVPVHWKAYDDRVKRYQGEIQQKDVLKERFLQKAEAARQMDDHNASMEWGDMRRLLDCVFDAFNAQQCAATGAETATRPGRG